MNEFIGGRINGVKIPLQNFRLKGGVVFSRWAYYRGFTVHNSQRLKISPKVLPPFLHQTTSETTHTFVMAHFPHSQAPPTIEMCVFNFVDLPGSSREAAVEIHTPSSWPNTPVDLSPPDDDLSVVTLGQARPLLTTCGEVETPAFNSSAEDYLKNLSGSHTTEPGTQQRPKQHNVWLNTDIPHPVDKHN